MVSRFWKQPAALDLSASTWSACSFGFFPSNQNVNYRLRTPTRSLYSCLYVSACVCVYVCVCAERWFPLCRVALTFTKYAYDKLIAIVGKGELISG